MAKKSSHSSYNKSAKLPKNISDEKVQKLLLENFVVLQKVMTDMSSKFDNLSNNISKLLNLFESSAKSFTEKQGVVTKEDKEFLEKLDRLLDQNKTIARGLTMMEERVRDKFSSAQQINMQGYQIPRQMENIQNQTQEQQSQEPQRKTRLLPRF